MKQNFLNFQIFLRYFFLTGSLKIFAAVYLRTCSTRPFIFSHPSTSLLECQLILLKKSSTTEMGKVKLISNISV